jgi:hypothetical protein
MSLLDWAGIVSKADDQEELTRAPVVLPPTTPVFGEGEIVVKVHFESNEDVEAFSRLLEQAITPETKFLWWPQGCIRGESSLLSLLVDE